MKETLEGMREYFNRSTRPLEEAHAGFAPRDGLYTVAGHVAHVAQTIEWFYDSAFSDTWRMDFDEMDKQARGVTSLADARAWFEARGEQGHAGYRRPQRAGVGVALPAESHHGRAAACVDHRAVTDHTAHHRGAAHRVPAAARAHSPHAYMDM